MEGDRKVPHCLLSPPHRSVRSTISTAHPKITARSPIALPTESVPEDVSVMGCDDISLCEYTNPTLTTIRTHFQEIGTVAAQEVLRLIRGEPGRLIRQNGLLVERKSCAPADR